MAANQGGSTVAATDWIPVMDDASLPEGGMQPAYPRGLNVVMARVDGTATRSPVPARTWLPDLRRLASQPGHHLPVATTGVSTFGRVSSWMRAKLRLAVYPVRSENGKLFINLG